MQKGIVRKRRPSPPSEYARQLLAKQELKREYDLRERQFKNYVREALEGSRERDADQLLIEELERRLDNVAFRMGLAETRSQGRQIVGHGHILVNGKIIDIPSYQVKKGDVLSIHPSSLKSTLFKNALLRIKKYTPPLWIELDKETGQGKITGVPGIENITANVDIPLVLEFYSR